MPVPYKTQFQGPIMSGIDTGVPTTRTVAGLRFTTLTTVQSAPVTGLLCAILPGDAVLQEINIMSRTALAGEAICRFATTADGTNNLGQVTVSARGKYAVAMTTAMVALPLGRTSPSAGTTNVFFSTGATSGSLAPLGPGAVIEVIYTRLDLSRDPTQGNLGYKEQATHFIGPIASGIDRGTGILSSTIGYAHQTQRAIPTAAPVTAQQVATIPIGGHITSISIAISAALGAEALVRFSTLNDGGDNLGSVTVSGTGRYSALLATAMHTLPFARNNTGSAAAVYMSILTTSGTITALSTTMAVETNYTHYDDRAGFLGPVGQKATTFRNALGSGIRRGTSEPPKAAGWARFSQMTTVSPNTGGVVSSQLIGVLPVGAALFDIVLCLRTSMPGEMRSRAGTPKTGLPDFASDNLGTASVSAAGRYSLITTTANFTIPGGVVQGSDLPVYVSQHSLSGSISIMSTQSVYELVYARMDPAIWTGKE